MNFRLEVRWKDNFPSTNKMRWTKYSLQNQVKNLTFLV